MKRIARVTIFLCLYSYGVFAQWPAGLVAYYSDSFEEWEIRDEMDVTIGNLRSLWADGEWYLKDWIYDIEGSTGQIRLKRFRDFNVWHLTTDTLFFTAQTRRSNDFSDWDVWGHGQQITIQSYHPFIRDQWLTIESNIGEVEIYTTYEGELGDWTALDNLDPSVSAHLKFFLMFLAFYNRIFMR